MFSALKWPSSDRSPAIAESTRRDVAEKAAACRGILFAARELALQQGYGAPVERLLARASEAIDGIDRILVALDPVRDAPMFGVAANLQRQLEGLQASLSDRRRRTRAAAVGP